MEKKIIPGEAFITGKRAYVFDGVKIIRMLMVRFVLKAVMFSL